MRKTVISNCLTRHMYLDFRPLPSELPFLCRRSAPRFVLLWLKQESLVGKIHNWHNCREAGHLLLHLKRFEPLTRSKPRKLRGLPIKQRFAPSQPLASTKIECIFANFNEIFKISFVTSVTSLKVACSFEDSDHMFRFPFTRDVDRL